MHAAGQYDQARAFRKLGIASRAELGARMGRPGR
jgi:hypothetical protein